MKGWNSNAVLSVFLVFVAGGCARATRESYLAEMRERYQEERRSIFELNAALEATMQEVRRKKELAQAERRTPAQTESWGGLPVGTNWTEVEVAASTEYLAKVLYLVGESNWLNGELQQPIEPQRIREWFSDGAGRLMAYELSASRMVIAPFEEKAPSGLFWSVRRPFLYPSGYLDLEDAEARDYESNHPASILDFIFRPMALEYLHLEVGDLRLKRSCLLPDGRINTTFSWSSNYLVEPARIPISSDGEIFDRNFIGKPGVSELLYSNELFIEPGEWTLVGAIPTPAFPGCTAAVLIQLKETS